MEIIVQGKGTEFFTPNEVILNIGFNTKGQSYEEVLSEGVKNVQKFVNELLLQNGFTTEDMKTRNFVVREDQKYDEVTRTYLFDGFSFNQNATLKFDYNKERMAKIMEDLSKLDNVVLKFEEVLHKYQEITKMTDRRINNICTLLMSRINKLRRIID